MAWVLDDYGYKRNKGEPVDQIEVDWKQKDDANPGFFKEGAFKHTLDGGKTWDLNKADIVTKIMADEGMVTGPS